MSAQIEWREIRYLSWTTLHLRETLGSSVSGRLDTVQTGKLRFINGVAAKAGRNQRTQGYAFFQAL